MSGPPNAVILQYIIIFNTIYYMGQWERENLRGMKTDTFKIAQDHNKTRYIYQAVKESDKNHTEKDFQSSNEAMVYEVQGS